MHLLVRQLQWISTVPSQVNLFEYTSTMLSPYFITMRTLDANNNRMIFSLANQKVIVYLAIANKIIEVFAIYPWGNARKNVAITEYVPR